MQLYLGFDETCSSCSQIGKITQEETRGEIVLSPLSSPLMRQAEKRAGVMKSQPLLVSVSESGQISGVWHGRRMGLMLTRVIGPRKSLRLASALRMTEEYQTGTSRRLAIKGAIAGAATIATFAISPTV